MNEQTISLREAVKNDEPTNNFSRLLLNVEDWENEKIKSRDFILGELLSTTSRAFLVAPTGRGKSHFSLAVAIAMAAGIDWLHFDNRRPARILYIDAEMPADVCRSYLLEALNRLPSETRELVGNNLTVLNYDDALSKEIEIPPLNTEAGRKFILDFIMSLDGIDFIFFDNLMTLVLGDLKEETTWTETLPLVHILTSMRIGQVWIDHTGWNEERAYGANVKLWQMDTVMRMKNASKTEIDFTLAFDKNRFKSPTNKEYYEEVQISLRNNKWIGSAPAQTNGSGKLPHKQQLAYQALLNLINEGKGEKKRPKRDMPVVTVIKQEDWREELFNAGVTDRDKLDSERSIRRNLSVALVNKNYIGFWKDELWVVRDTVTDRDNQVIDTAAYRNVT